MKTALKPLALLALCVMLPNLAPAAPPVDPFQRYIKITNELPVTVYPVVQVPESANCSATSTLVDRIIVNSGAKGAGLPSGKTVLVNIPKNCWYTAGRVFLFAVDVNSFEDRLQKNQQTTPDGNAQAYCPNEPAGTCWSGTAGASYPGDSPAQLVEYTFIAMNPATGNAFPNGNNPNGIPMADIDVSYVDDAYLPVALNLDDGGATAYMGTAMSYGVFNLRTASFIGNTATGWSEFAAYTPANWPNNDFNDLGIKRTDHIPGAYNLVDGVNSGGLSGLYQPTSSNPPACSAWPGCQGLAGNCCPTTGGSYLACCGLTPYLIDRTSLVSGNPWNPSLDAVYARWNRWLSNKPCANLSTIRFWPSTQPQFKKQLFCDAFQTTVQYVWKSFQQNSDVQKTCASYTGTRQPYCILEQIIGYKTGQTVSNLPKSGRLPQSVQALMRGVPWVSPQNLPSATQYQGDKWLLFWAPYPSIFNLNPYTRLIHNAQEGINAPGAYSFSIDDLFGNLQDRASGFIIDIGGSSALVNGDRFDPYEQYRIVWGAGWDHATICGRNVQISGQPSNARITFWQNGTRTPYCDIALYQDSAGANALKYRVVETTNTVTDPYTGLSGQSVSGLQFINPQFCANNSSPSLQGRCVFSTFSPTYTGDNAYVSLPDAQKPLVNLNAPSPTSQ